MIKLWLNNYIPKALIKLSKFGKRELKTLALSNEMSTIMKQIFVMLKILGYFGTRLID